MPKTIADAIDLVFALGLRYLWVDAISIVQDEASQKHHTIQYYMDVIYNKAYAIFVW